MPGDYEKAKKHSDFGDLALKGNVKSLQNNTQTAGQFNAQKVRK